MGDVDRILSAIAQDCDAVRSDLTRLATALDSGLGEPHATEMTPNQADRLATILGNVGVLGGIILTRDLERTSAREGGA